jgi:TonB family protein
MWMAVVRDQQKDFASADALFKQALAAEDANSADAATTMNIYAAFLRRQDRDEEAKNFSTQASTIRNALRPTQYRQRATVAAVHVGNGVTAPMLVQKVEPEYSEEARAARYQGTVVVAVTIDTDGTAQDMKIVRGLGLGLDEKALQAISQWKFKPGAREGQPVPVMATIEVNFRLL